MARNLSTAWLLATPMLVSAKLISGTAASARLARAINDFFIGVPCVDIATRSAQEILSADSSFEESLAGRTRKCSRHRDGGRAATARRRGFRTPGLRLAAT